LSRLAATLSSARGAARVLSIAALLAGAGALAFTARLAREPASAALSADVAPAQQAGSAWSSPAVLNPCPAGPAAQVVFPSDSPSHATGAGAIVWSDSSHCPGGEGARVAALGAGDEPLAPSTPRTAAGQPIAPRGALLAAAAPHGQVVIAGTAPSQPAGGLLIQGAAGGPFAALQPLADATAPTALATGYLGDLALAAVPADPQAGRAHTSLSVRLERFYAHAFNRDVVARDPGSAPVQALTLAMDYRSEVLAAWTQGGAIYTRLIPNRGPARPPQRLASVGSHAQIAAVLSDDERAIVAWSEQRGSQTSVYVDRSATGVRFRTPQLLGRFTDPDGLSAPAASPSLVRLSSETVMLAWAGSESGHWVVRAASVDLNGVGAVSTIAAPGVDALLAHLAPGPADDALLLWTEPLPTAAGPPDLARQAIFAARGYDAYQARAVFGQPEQVATPAPVSDPTVAFDPASDRAVAVWRGEAAAVEYAIRAAGDAP
jgi:hypothetical protein